MIASPVNRTSYRSLLTHDFNALDRKTINAQADSGYNEAQVWGGVRMEDIDTVIFTRRDEFDELAGVLHTRWGINSVLKEGSK